MRVLTLAQIAAIEGLGGGFHVNMVNNSEMFFVAVPYSYVDKSHKYNYQTILSPYFLSYEEFLDYIVDIKLGNIPSYEEVDNRDRDAIRRLTLQREEKHRK